jgi:hypothetical protein
MPLPTEEQRRRLQARMGQPPAGGGQASTSTELPAAIKALVAGLPPAQSQVSYGPSGPRVTPAVSNQQIEREMGVAYIKGRVKALTPQMSATIQRDFSRIDAFEGILSDLESSSFRKGPVKGTYAKLGAKLMGGGKFGGGMLPEVSQKESEDILTYSDMRPGVAAGLYRAITGDDRISDMDAAQRALPFVPDPYLQPGAFAKRIAIVKKAIQRKRASIRKSITMGGSQPLQEGTDSAPIFNQFMSEAIGEDD